MAVNRTDLVCSPDAYTYGSATDIGLQRMENQDSLYADQNLGLFIVADGMGGHAEGALASKIVVDELPKALSNNLETIRTTGIRSIKNAVKKSIDHANHCVCAEGVLGDGHPNMGSTVVMLLLTKDRAYIANVGDSRAYIINEKRIRQMSQDHSVVADMIENGIIHPDDAQDHPARGHITQCLGINEDTEPFIRSVALKENETFLFCSDGVTDVVTDDIIKGIVNGNTPQKACEQLVAAANNAGGPDNITAVVVKMK